MDFVRRVDRVLDVCEHVFHVLANACLAVMLTANILNIASRAIIDRGIVWVFPWSVVLFVWMTFLGFFVLYRKRRDIVVNVLIDRFGPRARKASRLLIGGIVLVLMAVMMWHAPQALASQEGTIEMVGLQRYTMSIPLFASCLLITVTYLVDVIDTFAGVAEPSPDGEAED